jgi:hypothetical protein
MLAVLHLGGISDGKSWVSVIPFPYFTHGRFCARIPELSPASQTLITVPPDLEGRDNMPFTPFRESLP